MENKTKALSRIRYLSQSQCKAQRLLLLNLRSFSTEKGSDSDAVESKIGNCRKYTIAIENIWFGLWWMYSLLWLKMNFWKVKIRF